MNSSRRRSVLMKSIETTVASRRSKTDSPALSFMLRSSRRRARGDDELGIDVELVPHLRLPLLGQVRRAEHRHAPDLAPVEQLAGDQQRLDRLADAHVVGDEEPDRIQPKGHQQRHQLVGPRLHGDPPERAERARRSRERDRRSASRSRRPDR